ncbi:MAG TPA: hypothetical protein VNY82_12350 [Steroidobacteraceae bacterium]|nr:hypothetical protein [Steroidobacteraceae bacterium]
MAALSEWLQIMLAEIARKRDDVELARAEEARRATEVQPNPPSENTAKEPREARSRVSLEG